MEVHPDVLRDMADGKTVPTKYGDWQIAWMASEILRLRALCAARPKHPMQDGFFGAVLQWQEKIDAAGEGKHD